MLGHLRIVVQATNTLKISYQPHFKTVISGLNNGRSKWCCQCVHSSLKKLSLFGTSTSHFMSIIFYQGIKYFMTVAILLKGFMIIPSSQW